MFVCCDPEDFEREFGSSEMYRVMDKHANSILLFITVPPPPRKAVRVQQQQQQQLEEQPNSSVVTGDQSHSHISIMFYYTWVVQMVKILSPRMLTVQWENQLVKVVFFASLSWLMCH